MFIETFFFLLKSSVKVGLEIVVCVRNMSFFLLISEVLHQKKTPIVILKAPYSTSAIGKYTSRNRNSNHPRIRQNNCNRMLQENRSTRKCTHQTSCKLQRGRWFENNQRHIGGREENFKIQNNNKTNLKVKE